MAGCTPTSDHASSSGATPTGSSSSAAGGIQDPLSEITDKSSPDYVADSIQPLLHTSGTGPSHFTVTVDAQTRQVQVYVACAPDSAYAVHIGKGFSGNCSTKFQNFADIPVEPGKRDLNLSIPDSTTFTVLVISKPS